MSFASTPTSHQANDPTADPSSTRRCHGALATRAVTGPSRLSRWVSGGGRLPACRVRPRRPPPRLGGRRAGRSHQRRLGGPEPPDLAVLRRRYSAKSGTGTAIRRVPWRSRLSQSPNLRRARTHSRTDRWWTAWMAVYGSLTAGDNADWRCRPGGASRTGHPGP